MTGLDTAPLPQSHRTGFVAFWKRKCEDIMISFCGKKIADKFTHCRWYKKTHFVPQGETKCSTWAVIDITLSANFFITDCCRNISFRRSPSFKMFVVKMFVVNKTMGGLKWLRWGAYFKSCFFYGLVQRLFGLTGMCIEDHIYFLLKNYTPVFRYQIPVVPAF